MSDDNLVRVSGSCHCQAVTFEAEVRRNSIAQTCNCSICRLTGFVHLIVPASRFRLLSGEDALVTYRFNTGIARHLFCRICGVKSFYVPRSNPDGVSLNLRCLMLPDTVSVTVQKFDGRNWEAHAGALQHLSASEGM